MFLLHQELGVKHPLHRKKLQLALQQINSTGKVKKMDLDHHWVTSKCSVKARVKKNGFHYKLQAKEFSFL